MKLSVRLRLRSLSSFISSLRSNKIHLKSRSLSRLESSSSDDSYHLRSTPNSVLRSPLSHLRIPCHELEAALRRLCPDPPTDDEVSAIVAARDVDGCITMADLGKICDSDDGGEDELREAFGVFDANGDGKISAEELLQVFLAMGEACSIEECRRMIGGVDSDGDGFVCFEDFLKMMALQS